MELSSNEIQKYVKLIIKRRYLFILLSLCIISVIVWGSYLQPKMYEAKTTVFIESNVIERLVKDIAITPSMRDRIKVLRYTMLSRGLVLKVLQDLDQDIKAKNNKALDEMVADFQKRTKINIKDNGLFTVSIRDKDPKLASDYINTLVRRYVEENISAKREEAYGASRFIKEQVSHFKGKLDKSENAIISFRQKQGIFVAMDERAIVNEIKNYETELEEIKIQKKELLAAKNSIKRQLAGEEPYTVAVISSSSSKDILIAKLQNRLERLLLTYTENYPEVVKLKGEIEALKTQQANEALSGSTGEEKVLTEPEMSTVNPIYQELKQRFFQKEAKIESLNARQRQLSALITKKEKELRYVPEGKKKLGDLEKERDTYKGIYEELLVKLGQSEVSKQLELEDKATTFRIIEPAIIPTIPASPDRVKMILVGILLGFGGGFGGVFLREQFDSSIKDVQMLRNLGVEVLATIPKIFNKDEHRKMMRKDLMVYTIAGFYFLIICATLVHEILGYTYVETMISQLRDTVTSQL